MQDYLTYHHTTLHVIPVQAIHYRNLAEELKGQNRMLRVEMSEKIETVRNFWRNSILEESTRAGKMVVSYKERSTEVFITIYFTKAD